MPPEIAFPILCAAIIGSSGLTGVLVWLAMRTGRRGELGRDETERLREALESVNERLFELRDSVTELHERMDFAERLLTKGKEDA
jgi:PleD family two-component response regulator